MILNNVFYCFIVRAVNYAFQPTEEMLKLVQRNFTETMSRMQTELEMTTKERIRYQLEAIAARRDKAFLEERITAYEKMCKEDFVQSLQGIPDVSREFLKRVDELFVKHESFQLSCENQRRQLEDIRVNCSNLSSEVETKLQLYLDKVGSRVTTVLGANAKYITENKRLHEDATWCKNNHSAAIEENKKVLDQVQSKHDQDVEKLLLQVRKLSGNERLQQDLLSVKDAEIKILMENIRNLNVSLTSCMVSVYITLASSEGFIHLISLYFLQASQKSPFGQFPGGSANSYQWINPVSTGSRFPGPGTAGLGSSATSLGSLGSSDAAFGRTGAMGTNSVVGGFGSAGSSGTGLGAAGSSKLGSSNTGLSGTGFSNPGSSRLGFGAAGSTGIAGSGGTFIKTGANGGTSGGDIYFSGKK